MDADFARTTARRRLPRMMFDFADGATGREHAMRRNELAFQSIRLQPRVLIDVEDIDLRTTFLDARFDVPFGIAPMGM
ncbi:MAG: alpha-hydroxy-acid oxidizing protein, partial [Hyphomicrobiaceae bacterium]